MKINPIIILLLLGLVACAPEEKQPALNQYFDLDTFVKKQIAQLNSLHPVVEKKVSAGQQEETKQLTAINWGKELDLFLQADLNKSAYRNSYLIEKPTARSFIYRAKPGEDIPVKYLKIELDSLEGRLENVEAVITSENYLYHSEKKLSLHCALDTQGQWLVNQYHVSGFQRLAFFAKKPFDVQGKVFF
ncbi:MAG: hypothetical protein V4714_16690 [Bacteroidota bacterium]